MDDELKTILDYLRFWNFETPNKIAYIFTRYVNEVYHEKHITCKQVYNESCKYAYFFEKSGVKKGERVVVFAKQCPETIYAIYGVLMIGGILVLVPEPVDTAKQQRLRSTLNNSGATYIIAEDRGIIDVDTLTKITYIDLKRASNENYKPIRREILLDDIACIQYTSGSTDEPKGIIISHRNIIEAMKVQQQFYPMTQEDIHVTWLPYFHAFGLVFDVFFNAYTDKMNIVMTVQDFLEKPRRWLEVVSKHRGTAMTAPISSYLACIKDIGEEEYNLSSLKYLISAAEPILKNDWKKVYDCLKNYGLKKEVLYPMYGLSETFGGVTAGNGNVSFVQVSAKELQHGRILKQKDDQEDNRVLISVGYIPENVGITIVNPNTLIECPDNEVGEVWIQGASIAEGYWKNEELTQKVFKAKLLPYEGTFFRTGDLGFIIENQLYITGRCKEMMIVNGHNIYPKDVESNIKKGIKELRECLVYTFSLEIQDKEQMIVAIEYEGREYSDLIKRLNAIVYGYFGCSVYDIVILPIDGLPKTHNGKIAIKEVRERYLLDDLMSTYSLRHSVQQEVSNEFSAVALKIKNIFEEILEVECTSAKSGFYELGGTSLQVMALLKKIKKVFGVWIPLEQFMDHSSVEEIESIVNRDY